MALVLERSNFWDSKMSLPIAGRDSWGLIVFLVDDTHLAMIHEKECGLDAWKKFHKLYVTTDMHSLLRLLRELFTLEYTAADMATHIDGVEGRVSRLKAVGLSLDDNIVMAVLLMFPKRFESMVKAWEASSVDLKFDQVHGALINAASGLNTLGGDASSLTAQTV
jgi:hypothetical protein